VISVLIATFNGADTLPRTLDALAHLDAPPGGWRLIVVDNGSTDEAPAILRAWAGRLPLLLLREPVRGKSRALNLGLDHCDDDLIVLTDDDVLPSPKWLVAYHAAATAHPAMDVFNGPIKPHWDVVPPE
jgi:glycosyltransferase involved in cell wall biosynthesis